MKPQPIGEERITYQGKMIEVVEQDMQIGGKVKTFERARRAPGTRLIIVNPDGSLKLSREHRTELDDYDYRLPGGKVFDSLAEYSQALEQNIDMCAKAFMAASKEAREEVGISVNDISLLGISKNGATVEWDLYYFLVTDYTEAGEQELETGEVIEIVDMPLSEVRELCLSGAMQEDRSVARLLQYIGSNS